MDGNTYIKNALVTEACDYSKVAERLQDRGTLRLLHGSIGLATEVSGEDWRLKQAEGGA